MENKNFVNIDENIINETAADNILKCVDDDKLIKRMMISSLGEILSTLDNIDKTCNAIRNIQTIGYKGDIEAYYKELAKKIREQERETKKQQEKNNVENNDNVN